jgi:tryptophanyl-tRNA synthetase
LCLVKDFSQPASVGRFNLVLSLEVGEHIPAQYEQTFIDNLINSSREYIVLSWAVENQPGIGHVNCRNNDFVISEFQKRGLDYSKGSSEYLREHSTLPWFKNTLMVFIK